MSTKLSFRARALDPSKPMPIFLEEELPDLHEYSAINRAVPQMPSGMEKEEESEHHLQRAIVAGLIIPTPDVAIIEDLEAYERLYPPDFKMPRQLIHVQPLSLEQDIPDYDMDSEDEQWLSTESKADLTPYRFEQMMDKLEKGSTCTLDDAKALVKRNEVTQEVFDFWVTKRLRTKHPLLLTVKTECRGGTTINNPYIAFRRRTEKMQTRKNRKNDEASYEKMLKLRRDLSRAVKLLEMVKRREKMKKEDLQLSIDIYEKRYQAKDFTGQLLQEYTAATTKSRPAFAPLYPNQYYHNTSSNLVSHSNQWNSSQNYPSIHLNHHHLQNKRDFDGMSTSSSRKEKRQYKKRKHKTQREQVIKQETYDGLFSSDDEDLSTQLGASESEDEGIYPFRRNRNCNYFKPYANDFGDWPWESQQNTHLEDPRYRFSLTSLRHPRPRCIGFARRRVGRGGRIILDRVSSSYDDIWSKLDFTILDNEKALNSDVSERLPATNDNNSEINNQSAVTLSATVSSSSIDATSSGLTKLQQTNHFNSNIVIKSENSKPSEIINSNISDDQSGSRVSDQHQKLDDFEQLLDSANASSNIINKNLVCKKSNHDIINNDGFHPKTVTQNSSISEIISSNSYKNSNLGVLNSFNAPDTNTTGISSTNSAGSLSSAQSQKLEFDFSIPTISSLAATSTTNQMAAAASNCDELPNDHDSYRELFDEIQDDWLHFQPLSPPLSPSENLIFESDLMSDMKKFSVELQMLDNNSSFYADNETENHTTNCIDSTTYLTQPMTFNCRNNSLEILNTTNTTQHDSIPSTSLSSEVVTIKTEPMDEDSKEIVQMTNCIDGNAGNIADDKDEFSMLISNIDYTKPLFDSPIGCSEFKLTNEKALMQQLEIVPMETECSQSTEVSIKTELEEPNSVGSIAPIAIIKEAPIAELQSHNYVLQYGSPVSTPTTIVQNENVKYATSNLNATITNSTNLIPQQFVNAGNTIISSASPSQQNKMQSIVYDNNTFVLTAAPQRKQLNGPADRGLNQNQKFKQVFMLDLSQTQDKRKAIGALNDSNLIKKPYSDLGISSQNILVSSLNSNLNSNNIGQQSQQFSLVHQKPIILGASTSGSGGTFMQSTAGGNATNKIIVTPASQLSGNIYMSTHGKLVIPSSNQQSIILDNAKMITTNQTTSQPQAQQTTQQKLQPSPTTNQQRVKMENKMNMLIESTSEKNIIIAKYNKNNKIFQNVIPVAAANKNSTQSPTTKQISQITSTQPQQQSISVVSSKPIQRIPGSFAAVQQQPPQTQQQILRTQQFGASSVNFQNSPTTKIIQQQQSNNGSTVKSNDNSSTSPR